MRLAKYRICRSCRKHKEPSAFYHYIREEPSGKKIVRYKASCKECIRAAENKRSANDPRRLNKPIELTDPAAIWLTKPMSPQQDEDV